MKDKGTNETEYGLVLSFVDQSPSFTYGWEAGVLYNDLSNKVDVNDRVLAWANYEMVERILTHFSMVYTIDPVGAPEDTPHWFILRDVEFAKPVNLKLAKP